MPGKTVWIDTLLNMQVATGAQARQSIMTAGITAQDVRLTGMTLLRTIIGLDIAHLVHDSGEGSQIVDLGIGVSSQEAVDAGVIADPATETDFPVRGWIYRGRYRTYGFAADQAAVYNARVDLDIRARRKLDNGEAFIVVDNTADQGSTGSIVVMGLLRHLWLIT